MAQIMNYYQWPKAACEPIPEYEYETAHENKKKIVHNEKLFEYMRNYLEIITTVSSILCICSGTEENLEKRKELMKYIKRKSFLLYAKLRYRIEGVFV